MNSLSEVKGRCLCGAVELKASSISANVGACHCGKCRKWGGGPLMAIECQGELDFSGAENITTFTSSDWAERGFCSKCGSHLFYRLTINNQYIIPVGVFDVEDKLRFDHQIFVEEKPEYYAFANDTKNMTGEEVFAQYSDA